MSKSSRVLLSLVLLVVGAAVGWYATQFFATPAPVTGSAPRASGPPSGPPGAPGGAPRAMAVELAVVESISFPRGLSAIGSLRSDESTLISAEITGRVAQINFREGQPVKRGDLLVQLDDEVAQAEFAQAQANLALAQSRYDRSNRLQTAGFVSAEAREDAQNQLKLQQAALKLSQAKLDKTRILAPFDGVIGLRSASVGDYVTPGQSIAPLEAVSTLKVDFRLPERHVADVALNQRLELQVDARAGDLFDGVVYAISPLIEEGGRSVLVRAQVDNTDGLLRPGMFARVHLITEEVEVLVVPEAAISPSGQSHFVYRLQDGKAERVAVQMGERRAGLVEIAQGLEAGDQVVVAGLQRIRNGLPITSLGEPRTATEISTEASDRARSLRVNPS